MGPGCMVAFFGLFFLVGAGTLTAFFLIPIYRTLAARSWVATPCTILSSAVRSHSGDSATYSIEIAYTYRFGGSDYRSERYDFLGGSSSGHAGKAAIVARYPPGSEAICYVNPTAPSSAVLSLGFRTDYWIALVPALFAVVGVWGMIFGRRAGRRQRATAAAGRPEWLPTSQEPEEVIRGFPAAATGPLLLKPQHTPLGKLFGTLAVALFWNGIVSVFVYQVWAAWRAGEGVEGCLVVYLIPFVLIGLALASGVPYYLLALANPRPFITLPRATIRLGEALRCDWQLTGATGRLENLRILLAGREEATYQRGTTSHTDKRTFCEQPLVEMQGPSLLTSGSAELLVPSSSMHSFVAAHNKIVWCLLVKGSIRRWPDVDEEFELAVLPQLPEQPGVEER